MNQKIKQLMRLYGIDIENEDEFLCDLFEMLSSREDVEGDQAEFTKKVVKDLIIYQDELAAAKERIAELEKQIEYLNIR